MKLQVKRLKESCGNVPLKKFAFFDGTELLVPFHNWFLDYLLHFPEGEFR